MLILIKRAIIKPIKYVPDDDVFCYGRNASPSLLMIKWFKHSEDK